MKRTIILFLLIVYGQLVAQDITRVEYFFDADPGYGNGAAVSITPASTISGLNISIPVVSLSTGYHTLFFRAQDENGRWSVTQYTSVYKLAMPSGGGDPDPVPNVIKAEYFFDTDPGYGNGTIISFIPATFVDNVVFDVDVSALAQGEHILFVRAQDENGRWSVTQYDSFNVCNATVPVLTNATSVTPDGFSANWNTVSGAGSYLIDVSTDNFMTYVSGYKSKEVFINTESISGLNEGDTYQYRVRSVIGCNSVYSAPATISLPLSTPTGQPTNLQFLTPTESSFQVTFTAAAGSPTGYLAIRRQGGSPSFVPVNNTIYNVGETVGNGMVAYRGSGLGFVETGLSANSEFYYDIYSYNSNGTQATYLKSSPLEGNFYTYATDPQSQPFALVIDNLTSEDLDLSFSASVPGVTGYLVVRKQGSSSNFVPVDGTVYIDNEAVGDATVVYIGEETVFNDDNLMELTDYYYRIFAFNGNGLRTNYLTVNPLIGSITTTLREPQSQPVDISFKNITSSSVDVSYSASQDVPTGYLVVRRKSNSPEFIPQVNQTYAIGQDVGTEVVVAYFGPAASFSDSDLDASSVYHYDIFAYNKNKQLYSYQTNNPLQGSVATFTGEPLAQPSNVVFSQHTINSIVISFTPASPVPTGGYLVLRKTETSTNTVPQDGQGYTLGELINDATVSYLGTANSFEDSGLEPGTVYHYSLFSYNGSGSATNYVTALSPINRGSSITISLPPSAILTSDITQTSFVTTWDNSVGASSYRIDVNQGNLSNNLKEYDNLAISGNTLSIEGLAPGNVYSIRLRAVNTGGVSVNSDVITQITVAATPQLTGVNNIRQDGFDITWDTADGAEEYYIDVSENNFTQFIEGYDNLKINTKNAFSIQNLIAGREYSTRLRSANAGGISPNSNIITQQLIPATPVGLDATNTTSTSFKAKWEEVEDVEEYRMDVSLSDNNFNPTLSDYDNISIVANEEQLVTGLSPNTAYRYRVRAVNSVGTSPNSPPVSVNTLEVGSGTILQLSTLTYPQVQNQSASASFKVISGVSPIAVNFISRGITKTNFESIAIGESTPDNYSVQIMDNMLDDLGIEFYFEVTDGNDITKQTETGFMYRSIRTSGESIPIKSFGKSLENYQLFSLPYQLDDNLIATIFDEMGAYDITKWRLMRYQGGKNVDFGSGITRIEQGKGYWFISKEEVQVAFNGGSVTRVNQNKSFSLRLEPGWNQIGNPFTFPVSWSEVLEYNQNIPSVGELKTYNSENVQFVNSDNLAQWSGGFVHNDEDNPVILDLPVTLKNGTGGRKYSARISGDNIDLNEWILPLSIQQNKIDYQLSAIGMHPEAHASKDYYDDILPPRWGDIPEFYVEHPEYFSSKFSRDVITTTSGHSWNFKINNYRGSSLILKWNQQILIGKNATLFLLDKANGVLINMSEQASYKLTNELNQITIIFSRDDIHLDEDIILNPYPNPSSGSVMVPLVLAGDGKVRIEVIGMHGRIVEVPVNGIFETGYIQFEWNHPKRGLYVIKYCVNDKIRFKRVIIK